MRKNLFFAAVMLCAIVLVSGASNTISLEEPEVAIKNAQAFAYCCIHHKGPYTSIEKIIGQLFSTMQGQGIPPGGAMIGVYYNSPLDVAPENLEWDIGFPCSAQASPIEPLEKRVWEFTRVASAIHVGPYEKTGETYIKIFEWMEANGFEQDGPILERYLDMPSQDTDPETLRSEIWVPIKKR